MSGEMEVRSRGAVSRCGLEFKPNRNHETSSCIVTCVLLSDPDVFLLGWFMISICVAWFILARNFRF
jgi:hypothetical protein